MDQCKIGIGYALNKLWRFSMIPCINKESLKLLVGTADERYQFSNDYFRKTHFPQIMHKYYQNQLTAEVTEQELLDELIDVDSSSNRVYLMFGSTGAGKSELLCWLKDRWILEKSERPVIRISRSELNPQIFIKKCYEAAGMKMKIQIDESRWELLVKKPITLINQIVWSTLAECLSTDEEIIPAALLLRPVIEKNITDFTKQIVQGKIKKPLEIINLEQFQELLESTSLNISLDYHLIKQTLIHKFDSFLFEGWDIGSLFKQLTINLKESHIRPLLLIDDLVQSVNIYATEILDQLITLEEGNWDVVIGLTPGSFRESTNGNELLQRIQNLDTIDDRVKKLWLSDESGKTFYNLDREQVVPYINKYLIELKATQGFNCSNNCKHFKNCEKIIITEGVEASNLEQYVSLLPFNTPFIRRVFDGIPIGKGKLRYMILHTKEIVRFFQKKDKSNFKRINLLIAREKYAEHSDLLVKSLAEWYSDENCAEVNLTNSFLENFGIFNGDMKINLHSLDSITTYIEYNDILNEEVKSQSNGINVRDWIEGKNVNLELLEPVRLGVSSLIHDIIKATNITRHFTPRNTSVIQKRGVENLSRYPISFSNKNKGELNIIINPTYSALEVTNIQLLKPSERVGKFRKLANELETAKWVYQSELLNEVWQNQLEASLGVPIYIFALELRKWVNEWLEISAKAWSKSIKSPFNRELEELAEEFYQDWYLLRENMVDSWLIKQRLNNFNFEKWLANIEPMKHLEQYQIGVYAFIPFFLELKVEFDNYQKKLKFEFKQLIETKKIYIEFFEGVKDSVYEYCREILIELLYLVDYKLIDFYKFEKYELVIQENDILEKFQNKEAIRNKIFNLIENAKNLNDQIIVLCKEIEFHSGAFAINNSIIFWIDLDNKMYEWQCIVNYLNKVHQCLSATPRKLVNQIMKVNTPSTYIDIVKRQWSDIILIIQRILFSENVENDLEDILKKWGTSDFYQIYSKLTELENRELETRELVVRIEQDVGLSHHRSKIELLDWIRNDNSLRPALRKQLINLLENGYSSLPSIQWKKLVEELKLKFPSVFEAVQIQLVLGKRS